MKIEFMHKTATSGTGACPAMYSAPGGIVFQGKRVGPEVDAQARDLAEDEVLGFVPQDVLDQYVAKILGS